MATQHARVALERIAAAVTGSFANESFPGGVVFADTAASYDYPDTLVVWRPSAAPADPAGLPRFSEIVVFCPNPAAPGELVEITSPTDTRNVPPTTDAAAWATELANLKTGTSSNKVLLTDLVRTATPSAGPATPRGAVRFAVELRPSAAAWASFRAGTLPFANVPWVQTIYGSQTGLRQTWVATELQLRPGYGVAAGASELVAIPFFGSAASYWNQSQ
jgi:hypothetical protein